MAGKRNPYGVTAGETRSSPGAVGVIVMVTAVSPNFGPRWVTTMELKLWVTNVGYPVRVQETPLRGRMVITSKEACWLDAAVMLGMLAVTC